jgi:hypothetical protein
MDTLRSIQDWYKSNCDENWEHDYGVKIDTLDNPGWSVAIDLLGTNLDGKIIEEVNCEVSANDWHVYKTENDQFIGYGDPTKLDYFLKVFIEWAKSQNEDWLQPPVRYGESAEEVQEKRDEEFWNTLSNEVPNEVCRHEDCNELRIHYSVLCRRHHFEMVTKRELPSYLE